jgi:WD40 repeat protein
MERWVASLHDGPLYASALATGFLIDERHVLTCAHVAWPQGGPREDLWVGFPGAQESMGPRDLPRIRVRSVLVPEGWPRVALRNVAALELEEALPQEMVAPISLPVPEIMVDRRWSAHGFPDGELGVSRDGTVGELLFRGWGKLNVSASFKDEGGWAAYHGAGLWSPDHQAVVGMVMPGSSDDESCWLTLRQIGSVLPDLRIGGLAAARSTNSAGLASLDWSQEHDAEELAGPPVSVAEPASATLSGALFRGRRAALKEIVSWITKRNIGRGVLVVTGSPGSGKSAVLRRIVASADPRIAAHLPRKDAALRPPVGSISCVVRARGKTAVEVAEEIARTAFVPIPKQAGDLVPALRVQFGAQPGPRFTLVLDGLDEAATPEDARVIVSRILVPLAELSGALGIRVVVGSRRQDAAGDLLGLFGAAAAVVDLEASRYFARDDLATHVESLLGLGGEERFGDAYVRTRRALASRIAACAEGDFLVAELVAEAHRIYDLPAGDPAELSFPATVEAAFDAYLAPLPHVDGVTTARQALTALAFAEPPGMGIRQWHASIAALYEAAPSEAELRKFARSPAANRLLATGIAQDSQVYELSHRALADVLRIARAQAVPAADDERRLTEALLADGRAWGWASAPPYTLRSLGRHAARGGAIDEVLAEQDFRLYADLRRLIPAADTAVTTRGHEQASVLRRTPRALDATPETRAAMFSVTEACQGLAEAVAPETVHAPYRAAWASTEPGVEAILGAGYSPASPIAVCAADVDGRTLLVGAGHRAEVPVWDAATGELLRTLRGNSGSTLRLRTVPSGDRVLLAGGGFHGDAHVWDLATGEHLHTLEGHDSWIEAMYPVPVGGGDTLLAVGGSDGVIRLWDAAKGKQIRLIKAWAGTVTALCTVQAGEGAGTLLACGGRDGPVRLFDPGKGKLVRELAGNDSRVNALCAVRADDRTLLAVGDERGTLAMWNPSTGLVTHTMIEAHGGEAVNALCVVRSGSRTLLASGGKDGTSRLWDPVTGRDVRTLTGQGGPVHAACAMRIAGRDTLVTSGYETMMRLWDLQAEDRAPGHARMIDLHTRTVATMCEIQVGARDLLAVGGAGGPMEFLEPDDGQRVYSVDGQHGNHVTALCAVQVGKRTLLAIGGGSAGVALWNPARRKLVRSLPAERAPISSLCAVPMAYGEALLFGGGYRAAWLWNPADGERMRFSENGFTSINAVCAVQLDGRTVVAGGDEKGLVRVWDPIDGAKVAEVQGDPKGISALCAVPVGDRVLLAGGGIGDGVVRLWDLATGGRFRTDRPHLAGVKALCVVRVGGRSLLASGGNDGVVRLWDLSQGPRLWLEIPVPQPVLSIAGSGDLLFVGLHTGALALEITPHDRAADAPQVAVF